MYIYHLYTWLAKKATYLFVYTLRKCYQVIPIYTPIDRIPDDVLSEGILEKLPLTSLCTCKCVSKLWNSLIIQNYHQSQRLPIICSIGYTTNPFRLCSIDPNNGTVTPLYSPIDLGPNKLILPFCSNGFICFKDIYNKQKIVVVNPATQENFIVPDNPYYMYNFGFDPCCNKYKLFLCKYIDPSANLDCEVFTLGTDSWRNVTSTPVQGSGKSCSFLFCFNGIIYWYTDTGMIHFFHLGTESFGVFQGPNSETPINSLNYMFDCEGCLCLAITRREPDEIMDLWMLKGQYNLNSGWVLIASVNIPLGKGIMWICPYHIRSGELLLVQCTERGSQSFYAYSLLTRQFPNIKICGHDCYYILYNFRENLVSLKDL